MRLFRFMTGAQVLLVDVAVMQADGGEAIGDINLRRHQDQVLGAVASAPTV